MNKIVRLGVSATLLAWIAWHTDWEHVGRAFAHLRLHWWLTAVGLLLVAQVVSALRWQLLARPLRFHRSLGQMTGYYFIGMYFSLLLPTSVGGDVVRAWYLDGGRGRRLAAFVSVLLDRLSGLLVLLVLACAAVTLSPLDLPAWMPLCVWGSAGCAVLGLALAPCLLTRGKKGALRAQQLRTTLSLLNSPRLLLGSTLLSLLVQVANVYVVQLVGLALDAEIDPSFYWVMVPMVALLTLLPISVNGMGVREGGTAVLLAPLGVSQATALTLAFLWFAVYVAASLLGGLVYIFGRFPKPAAAASPSEELTDHGPVDRDSDQGRARQRKKAA